MPNRLEEIPYSIEGLVRGNIGYSSCKIQAMKLAGLKFTPGLKTTRRSVLRFMSDNPQFRVSDFYGPLRLTPAELAQKYPECQVKLFAGEKGEDEKSKGFQRRVSSAFPARRWLRWSIVDAWLTGFITTASVIPALPAGRS